MPQDDRFLPRNDIERFLKALSPFKNGGISLDETIFRRCPNSKWRRHFMAAPRTEELMRYYCAPMEGLTDAVFRREQARLFPGGEADHYFSPFVSPTKDNRLDPRKLRDLLPENNTGTPFIPQIMCRQPAPFLWFAGELAAMGYREMNLNLGCPSGTVVAKGKGAGFLPGCPCASRPAPSGSALRAIHSAH